MEIRRLDELTFVAGQIDSAGVAAAAARGVRMIVNNRPDGEQPGQPAASEIEAAAEAAGIDYRFIPVAGGITPDLIAAMAEALTNADGPVLAFCRSGTRSTFLWALARAGMGDEPKALIGKAAAVGYDLSSIRDVLNR